MRKMSIMLQDKGHSAYAGVSMSRESIVSWAGQFYTSQNFAGTAVNLNRNLDEVGVAVEFDVSEDSEIKIQNSRNGDLIGLVVVENV